MDRSNFEDQTFEKIDYRQKPLPKGEYEYCIFRNCDFSGTDLSGILFLECEFSGCNLSNAVFGKTGLQDVKFSNCKMLGLHFEKCTEFGMAVNFQQCVLNHSSFFGVKLKKTMFTNCQLQEVDFTETDCSASVFDGSDLSNAVFLRTNLEKADLRKAINYTIDPATNKVKKASFSIYGLPGLLAQYDIRIELNG